MDCKCFFFKNANAGKRDAFSSFDAILFPVSKNTVQTANQKTTKKKKAICAIYRYGAVAEGTVCKCSLSSKLEIRPGIRRW